MLQSIDCRFRYRHRSKTARWKRYPPNVHRRVTVRLESERNFRLTPNFPVGGTWGVSCMLRLFLEYNIFDFRVCDHNVLVVVSSNLTCIYYYDKNKTLSIKHAFP